MPQVQPNERLAAFMRSAGVSRKALARLVGTDHTNVGRWLGGTRPRLATARRIADALSTRVGRTVSLQEIGLSASEPFPAETGIAYAETADETIGTVSRIWQADIDEIPQLMTVPPNGGAWSEASLGWLVRPESESIPRRNKGSRIGRSDIEAVRATAEMFAEMDNRFGGGHARRSLIQYLSTDVKPMLAGRYESDTGKALFSATAEALLLAAWMSYDSGIHGLAQRYFIQALRLAQAADDILLAGSILDAMSHQATFLGRTKEAANLARAARTGTRGHATATLTAHFHAMEARALAIGGDSVGAQRALSEAVRVFERRKPGVDPDWISYFDDAELSAEFGHCFRDLGRGGDAMTYAEHALANAGASARSDFFVTMVRAAGELHGKDVEAACATLAGALVLARQVKSARCAEYVKQFRAALVPFEHLAVVRELEAEHGGHHLWIASAA
ncbi:hypothetical protein EV385_3364 [Krasilnikovia cinnamomea]|uniref:HTH cro/C1-type domain-containing protein n=1 Tax=Krasilnikovia cinnamomea TaxID=349313 RepID=A0A4Q7ZLP8_9ACTN|nr:helix-turn-helix transcriptional regulator [Krasilnikovia cinnamomea]RZU51534.1 hypothetical protein EV385_3364 [Krasilnikovia cinnamomea]